MLAPVRRAPPRLALLLTAVAACVGDDEGATSSASGEGTETASTSASAGSSGSSGSSTSASSASSDASTDASTTDVTTTDASTTDASTTDASTTTASTTTASTDATSTTEASTGPGTTTSGGDGLVLDPKTLQAFALPIDSERYAIAGYDGEHGLCAAIIFFGGLVEGVPRCDDFMVGDEFGDPYVVITPSAGPPCTDWDYAGNVLVDAASGCVTLTSAWPVAIDIDMTLEVSGDPFTGTLTAKSP